MSLKKLLKKFVNLSESTQKLLLILKRKNATVEKKELNSYKDVKVCHEKKI